MHEILLPQPPSHTAVNLHHHNARRSWEGLERSHYFRRLDWYRKLHSAGGGGVKRRKFMKQKKKAKSKWGGGGWKIYETKQPKTNSVGWQHTRIDNTKTKPKINSVGQRCNEFVLNYSSTTLLQPPLFQDEGLRAGEALVMYAELQDIEAPNLPSRKSQISEGNFS